MEEAKTNDSMRNPPFINNVQDKLKAETERENERSGQP